MRISDAIPQTLAIPQHRIDEYFGVWAVLEHEFRAGIDQFSSVDLKLHLSEAMAARGGQQQQQSNIEYDVTPNGVAVVRLEGTMMKHQSSFGGASTVRVKNSLRAASRDESVRAIALVIDSPGGTVSGTSDLAAVVAGIAAKMPLYAFIQDTGASAAYWVASSATRVFANSAEARVGSIGTFTSLQDSSRRYAEFGVDVYVVNDGEFKGMGEPGTKITPAHLAAMKVLITDMNSEFKAAVATGRKVSQAKVNEWANGQVFVARKALAMGMIDGVQSLEATLEQLAVAKPPRAAAQPKASDRTTASSERSDVTQAEEDFSMDHQTASAPIAPPQATAPAAAPAVAQPAPVAQATAPVTAPAPAATAQLVAQPVAGESPATFHQLKAACWGADSTFIVAQLEANATIESAQRAWQTELVRQRDEANSKAAAATTTATNAQQALQKPGVPAPKATNAAGNSQVSAADPTDAFNEAVAEYTAKGKSRPDAVKAVIANKPDVYQAFLVATNVAAGRPVPQLN